MTDFNHQQYIQELLAAGQAFAARMEPGVPNLALLRCRGPRVQDTPYPFERALMMQIAQSAIEGNPNAEPDLEVVSSILLHFAWDRVVTVVPEEFSARFSGTGLPIEHDLGRIWRLPAQATYFAATFQAFDREFVGMWVVRDLHATTDQPTLRVDLVTKQVQDNKKIQLSLSRESNWDRAVQLEWGSVSRELDLSKDPQSATKMNSYFATMAGFEPIVAMLYELCAPEAIALRARRAASAPRNDLRIATIDA